MNSIAYTIIFFGLLISALTGIIKVQKIALFSIFFIAVSTLLSLLHFENLSEVFAVLVYLLLLAGVITQAVMLFMEENKYKENKFETAASTLYFVEKRYTYKKLIPVSLIALSFISIASFIWIIFTNKNLNFPQFPKLTFDIPKLQPIYKPVKLISPEDVKTLPSSVISPTVSEIDYKSLSILIKNGTIINGLASKSADILKKKGYQKLEIGNADKKNYTEWLIYYGENLEKAAEQIKLDLGIKSVGIQKKTGTESAVIIVIAGSNR